MSRKKTFEEFLKESKIVHGDKYDYSKVKWVNSHTPVEIICPNHGSFFQTPKNHSVCGYGCNKCAIEYRASNNRKTTDYFIEKARSIHGDLYDYSTTKYEKSHGYVDIICKKHGSFRQMAYCHLNGEGCPICNNSHLEMEVKNMLDMENIIYIQHYHIKELGKKELDFYLPDINIGIECQGKQHFGYGGWGGDTLKIIESDIEKKKICDEIRINIIYYVDSKYFKNLNGIYENSTGNIDELKKIIKKEKEEEY